LASTTTVGRNIIVVVSWSAAKKGTLVIKVVSPGKKIVIDGVGVGRI